MLVPDMTVAENVIIGLHRGRLPFVNLAKVGRELSALSEQHGLAVDPHALIEDLSVGVRQRVEILKLLYRKAEILVLDEPTAVLTDSEWSQLHRVLRNLAAEGRSVIFISHKLRETMGVADRCTVLRDGATVGTLAREAMTETELARLMVGRPIVLRVPRVQVEMGEVVFRVADLELHGAGASRSLDDVSFSVRAGEIFGIAGVDGNGQAELFDVLTGVRQRTAGSIEIDRKPMKSLRPRDFMRHSGALIPADRHAEGLALGMSVEANLIISDLWTDEFVRRGVLDHGAIRLHCERLVRDFMIDAPGLGTSVRDLSGGNQQKILLARSIYRKPKLLVAAQPTRGLDIGAMQFVYEQILKLKREGCAIVIISSDLEELLSLSDRLAVLVGGRFAAIVETEHADPQTIGLLMGGQSLSAA